MLIFACDICIYRLPRARYPNPARGTTAPLLLRSRGRVATMMGITNFEFWVLCRSGIQARDASGWSSRFDAYLPPVCVACVFGREWGNSFSATRGSSPRKIGRLSCKFHVWFLLHSQTRCNTVCSYQAKVAIDLCASPISVNPTIVPLGCSYVEGYLDRISNGTIPDDRRSAMTEMQSLVAESRSAQMSFGAMGISFLPVS